MGTFNVNGLWDKTKRSEVLNWIRLKQDDIVLIQETHSVLATEGQWENDWGGKIYFNHGESNSLGTAFLIRNKKIKVNDFKIVVRGRVSLLEIEYESHLYCLANIYGPNNDDTECVEKLLFETYGREKDDFVILGGDWNAVLNNQVDKLGGRDTHSNKKCQTLINTAMSEL